MRLPVYEGDKPYIFISYAHKDSERVCPIIKAMQQKGFRIWFDQGIEAGTEWPEFIAEHLEKAQNVIVFVSNAVMKSKNCAREVGFACDNGKEVLAVYIEQVQTPSKSLDYYLHGLHALFSWKYESDEDFLERLCGAKMLQDCREEGDSTYQNISDVYDDELIEQEPLKEEDLPEEETEETEETEEIEDTDEESEEEPEEKGIPSWVSLAVGILAVLAVIFCIFRFGFGWGENSTNTEPRTLKTSYVYDATVSQNEGFKLVYDIYYNSATGIVERVDIIDWFDRSVYGDLFDDETTREQEINKIQQNLSTKKDVSFAIIEVELIDEKLYITYKYEGLESTERAKEFIKAELGRPNNICVDAENGDYRMTVKKLHQHLLDAGCVRK